MKNCILRFFSAAILSCLVLSAYAQAGNFSSQLSEPVKWAIKTHMTSDSTVSVVISAQIENEWHLYSQYQKGTALPLVIKMQSDDRCKSLTGEVWKESPKYTEHYDDFFKETELYLSGTARFENEILLKSDKAFTLNVSVEGQACKDGACVPVSKDFSVKIDGRKNSSQKADASKSVVAEQPNVVADNGHNESGHDCSEHTDMPAADDTFVKAAQNDAANASPAPDGNKAKEEESLLWFFLLSFGGGIVALLTPCVFPVIPMTVSYFMKHGGVKQALFYGFSIIFIFLLIGLLFSAVFGQDSANYLSTHWAPNVIFAAIFVLFAFSLFGYYEIRLPSGWVNKTSQAGSSKAGYVGTFFMALTLVLASFSCTLPIAGTVILNAAAGGFVKPLIGMFGFSLAFALPFTAFAMFPSFLEKLPKSGSWMNTLKVTLAFIELAFALKFLSVPDQTYHWGILDREVYLSLWIVIFGMLGFYLLGKLKFPYDADMPVQKSLMRFVLALCSFAFTIYMIPGLFGAPLNGISGWLPPMYTQDFRIDRAAATADTKTINATFSDKLHAVEGVDAYFDYDEAAAEAVKQNKPLLLIFSGHGCVNCRKMEQMVLSDKKVQQYLKDNYVVAELFVDDKVIELPEHLQILNKDGKKITRLGEKNMYLQNSVYGHNSQPCYIKVNAANGSPLAEPLFYETKPESFLNWIEK